MDKLRQIIREIAKQRNLKPDCGCGCNGKCGKNEAPMINENLSRKPLLSEHLQYHVDNKKPITENTFRYGSKAFLDLWKEARKLYSRNLLEVSGLDKDIIVETNLGEYGIYEGQEVPLDLPMIEETVTGLDKDMVYAIINKLKSQGKLTPDAENTLKNYMDHPQGHREGALAILKLLDDKSINEAEYQGKNVQLNKPKRGGSKKFYVYVMDPKTKRVKKVQFGAAGGGQNLAVKIRDPKARKAFAARQNCDKKKDRTKPGYWSCNIGRYWKSLGGGSNFSGYW
jgi:hypothetical protein